ncbi:MAG: hypothetical protein HKL84_06520 [Acidimicrobiaceae bacterium]|nr:hypothetical protein [Acidimicrobiaceae bacterium]
MDSPRWFDRSLPQTLQIATLLLYMNGVVTVLFSAFAPFILLPAVAELVGAYGISNSKRWGYITAVVGAIFPLLILLIDAVSFRISIFSIIFSSPLTLIFEIALVALLLHPQSREHQKIWFH